MSSLKLRTLCLPTRSRTCLENLFFYELPVNQGKMTNQLWTTSSYAKIVGTIGKSFREHGREQKFRQTPYPLSRKRPLFSSKKPTGDGSQWTVRKPRTNYTNIVFANGFVNDMFECVYAALQYRHIQCKQALLFKYHSKLVYFYIFLMRVRILRIYCF